MKDLPTSRFPAASLALAMTIAGTVGAFVTETGLHPVTIVFWRCVFGAMFLGAWCLLRGYLPDRTLSPSRLALAALAGACMVLSWTAFFAGFAMTSIATTTIVYHVQPFFVVIIGVVFLKERISLDQMLWMLGAFLGVVLASGLVLAPGPCSSASWAPGIALTLGGGAALCGCDDPRQGPWPAARGGHGTLPTVVGCACSRRSLTPASMLRLRLGAGWSASACCTPALPMC